jgi:hypothetical protein
LAVMPVNQTALASSEEVTESLWITPGEALSRGQRSDFPILPPTTTVLNNLGRFSTWRALQKHFDLR